VRVLTLTDTQAPKLRSHGSITVFLKKSRFPFSQTADIGHPPANERFEGGAGGFRSTRMAKTAENPSENDHGDEENNRIPISIVAEATSDSEWHPATEQTVLLLPEATFCDDYESSRDGALSVGERALFAGGSLIALPLSSSTFHAKGFIKTDEMSLCGAARWPVPTSLWDKYVFVVHICLPFGRVLIAEVVIQGLTCCLLPNKSSRQR